MAPISVGRMSALETVVGNIFTTNITSLRQITQIYCEMNSVNIEVLDEKGITPAMMTKWIRGFMEEMNSAMPSSPSPVMIDKRNIELKPLTIPLLMQIEDAIGTPFYAGTAILEKIESQLVCVQYCYGLTDTQMSSIRSMPYPAYLVCIWKPLYSKLTDALYPSLDAEETSEKNQ